MPADLRPDGDEDYAELGKSVVAQPRNRIDAKDGEHGVDDARLHWREDIFPDHAHNGKRWYGKEEEQGAHEVAANELLVEYHCQRNRQAGDTDHHDDGVQDGETESLQG